MTTGPRRPATRPLIRLLLALLGALLLSATLPAPAQAEDGYRYWAYYQWTGGTWTFATKGPDAAVPADGTVEGWRFGLHPQDPPRPPRAAGDFDAICAQAAPESGKKRVALVIDPGTPQDAAGGQTPDRPTGTCVVIDSAANGSKVLAAARDVRIQGGIMCAIDGYPASGCGDPVKNITVPPSDPPVDLAIGVPLGGATTPVPAAAQQPNSQQADEDDGGRGVWLVAGIGAVVLALAAGALYLSRRRGAHT